MRNGRQNSTTSNGKAVPVVDDVPELDASFYDEPDDEAGAALDFDAWWADQDAGRPTATILGIEVPVPSQVPAEIALRPEKAMSLSVSDGSEIEALLIQLLDLAGADGADLLRRWYAAGIGSAQLTVIFMWALVNGMRPPGKPEVSFQRAYSVMAGTAGKAQGADQRAARARLAAARKAVEAKKPATVVRKTAGGRR